MLAMSSSRAPTSVSNMTNMALVVGGSDQLAATCRAAVSQASAGKVLTCGVKQTATVAADARPYAVVVPSDLYDFDPSEFDALGVDLNTEIIVVAENVDAEELVGQLLRASTRLV